MNPAHKTAPPYLLTDTSPTAAQAQVRVLRKLTPRHRLEVAVDMSLTVRALMRARLVKVHPDWPEALLRQEVLRLSLPGLILPYLPE
jgi:hypothetical protein